ncbi:MAG: tetratricopeptide repeat protein [Nanoarchaeota archaeon]
MAQADVNKEDYVPKYHTITHHFLDLERKEGFPVTDAEYETLDRIIAQAETKIKARPNCSRKEAINSLQKIDAILTSNGFQYQTRMILSEALKTKRTNCVTSSFIYKAIAETLDLPVHFSRAPAHLFIRWGLNDKGYVNWETTSVPACECPTQHYQRVMPIADSSIKDGVYLTGLTKTEALALPYAHIGFILQRKGDLHKAIKYYTKAITLYPKHAESHNNIGEAYIKLGNYEKAIAALTKAIELHPLSPESYNKRSIAYHKMGEKEKAIDDACTAFELS